MSDIDAFWAHPFFGKIVRAVRSSLNIHSDNFFTIFFYCLIMQKHCHIWLNGIPYHIADLQRNFVRIIESDYCTIIPNPDIQLAAVTVCKSNDFLFYIIYNYFLQLYGFTFPKNHNDISFASIHWLHYSKSGQLCQLCQFVRHDYDPI